MRSITSILGSQANSILKILAGSALFFVLALSLIVNHKVFDKNEASSLSLASSDVKQTRGIASVSPAEISIKKMKFQLNRELVTSRVRKAASVGSRPTDLDNLTFGLLEGKYAVRLESGKLAQLEFSDAQGNGDRPKYINDRKSFIQSYKTLLPVDFESVQALPSTGEKGVEIFNLISSDLSRVGQVHFKVDDSGRLISMKVFNIKSEVAAN